MKSWRQFKKEQGIVECDYALHELSNGVCLYQPDSQLPTNEFVGLRSKTESPVDQTKR